MSFLSILPDLFNPFRCRILVFPMSARVLCSPLILTPQLFSMRWDIVVIRIYTSFVVQTLMVSYSPSPPTCLCLAYRFKAVVELSLPPSVCCVLDPLPLPE